jgi:formamidopyrimidine-DNA glycosylase
MLEIPESATISYQVSETLPGRKITEVFNATNYHKFAWFYGDPTRYSRILKGRQVESAKGHGTFIDISCDEETYITIGDGTNIRYHKPSEKPPEKYQLLILFDNGSSISFTVAMYGGIWVYKGKFDNSYHQRSLNSISPLDERFDESLFDNIIQSTTKDISVKALLATEQRIPGLGNGVLQDILFKAGIHPKRKKSSLSDFEKSELFHSLKVTLNKMTDQGGRDTEKDFFGQSGGYKTLLSKNTVSTPCPVCGNSIKKEAYLGGAAYFCPVCQKL